MRWHDRGKDGIHPPLLWWMGNFSDALAAAPRLTPLCRTLLHTSEHHQMLARSLSAVSLWQSQKGRRAENMPNNTPGEERLSAPARCETRDRWKQEWYCLFHCLNRKQDGVSYARA